MRFGAKLVFIGERKPYPSEWFDLVLTPSPFETGANDVRIEMIPTRMNPDVARQAAEGWAEHPQGRLWTMVVGGTSSSHRYFRKDWETLAEAMNLIARREGIRWLVTSSRRTGDEAEQILKHRLDPELIAEAVWWAEKPEKKMAQYLGCGDLVFVTQDSVTMVTEALASGRRVIAIRPRQTQLPEESFLNAYFARLEEMGRLGRLEIAALDQADFPQIRIEAFEGNPNEDLASLVKGALGWERE